MVATTLQRGRGGGVGGVVFRHRSDSEMPGICFSTVAKQLRPRAFAQHFQKKKKKNVEKARVDILWTRRSREGLMRFTRRVVFYRDPSPILKQRGS